MIENTDQATLLGFVRKAVHDKVSLVATDEALGYRALAPSFPHEVVKHSEHEQRTREHSHQQSGKFWSLLKRGIVGTYHSVSKDYLPLYLAEFSFRHNNRKNPDIFSDVVAGC